MKLHTVRYDAKKLVVGTPEYEKYKKETSIPNVIYFFYDNDECLYIGETGKSLFDRTFKNTPCHFEKEWFAKGNIIYQLELDKRIDRIARGTLEATFILAFRPKNNKRA